MEWLDYEREGGLLWDVFLNADLEAARAAKDAFERFELPNPDQDQFFTGNNAERVPLIKYGLNINIVYRRPNFLSAAFAKVMGRKEIITAPVFEARKLVHDGVLQPLLQVDLSPNCCLEVMPGVEKVGGSSEDVKTLTQTLKADGISFYSRETDFIGIVREPSTEEKHSLVVNRRAIKPLDRASFDDGAAALQDRIYGGLSDEFKYAFDRSASSLARFMDECAKITALPASDSAKILHANWVESAPESERRRGLQQAAINYHRRLPQ